MGQRRTAALMLLFRPSGNPAAPHSAAGPAPCSASFRACHRGRCHPPRLRHSRPAVFIRREHQQEAACQLKPPCGPPPRVSPWTGRRSRSYLAAHGQRLDADPPPRQFAGGLANLNYLIHLDGKPAVLRRPPMGELPAGAYDMAREFRILSRLPDALPFIARGPASVRRSRRSSASASRSSNTAPGW